ncbi:protocadherin beta-15-like, partial [Numida meleagris]|uniref:protocadherin beta-15-like n=1 Tax=Numida meleagris TaxID=8996 RepID=UPI000B3DAD30
ASPAGRQHFRLERGSGRLVLAERLDREEMCGRSRTCTLAFELLLVDPLQIVRLEVSVEDINDHSPVFPDERVTFKIPELTEPGSRFSVVGAHDLDIGSNDIQAYSIIPENDYFRVSTQKLREGNLNVELVLQKALDREEQAELDFTLIATDGGSPPRSGSTQIHILVLDVNDNKPIFTQDVYYGKIVENAPEGSLVLSVLATDADMGINGNISYQFSQAVGQSQSAFTINNKNGEIRARQPLDFEASQKHELSVQATDGGGLSALCHVLIEVVDENDNAPEIVVSSFSNSIRESAVPGTVVAVFAVRDQDSGVNGEVSCALVNQLSFSLRPAFKNYYELVTVSTIASPAGRQHFRLERGSGRLVLAERLDREEMCGRSRTCTLAFELLLVDPLQFFPIEVSVVDINDHSPVFPDERVTFKIPETSDPGSRFPVGAAQDLDIGSNDIQAYSIVPENEYFSVFTQSESDKYIELVLENPLDREEQAELDFSLVATDGGSPPRSGSTQIHILVLDANDNAPIFTQKVYIGQVWENAPVGSVVLKVVASDADEGANGDISYQFSQTVGLSHSLFTINSRTGEIGIAKHLDFEAAQKHELTVQAIDGGGLSTMCNVVVEVVDVNDNAPEIMVSSFSSPIPENTEPGTVVALFAVRDRDSGVNGETSCALEDQLFFSLRPAFKNYYELVTVSTLDREERAQHIMVVTAADAGSPPLTTTHTFTVDISDVNDNAPVFNQTSYTMFVRENNVPALLVGAVNARDADAGPNGKVTYSLVAARPTGEEACSCVSVNSENGAVFVLRPLDYEQLRQLEVVVSAADAGSPALSASVGVRLVVLDENDNAPLVLHPAQDGSPPGSELVPAGADAGDVVTKVVAVDADSGQNSWLSYRLLRATEPGLFAVGAQSGEVRLTRPPTQRDAAKQKLVVLVRDNGRPPLSATAALSVLLLHGSWDAQLPRHSPAAHDDEDSSLTSYLIAALVFVSLLFFVSAAAFVACKACQRKEPRDGHVLYGPSKVQSCVGDGAAAGTLPHAYCYELSLTTGSGSSEFRFLKPVLPSLPAQHCSTGVADNYAEEFCPVPPTMGDSDFESPGTHPVGQLAGFSLD